MHLLTPNPKVYFSALLLLSVLSSCIQEQPKEKVSSEIKISESAEPSSINPFFIRDELGFYICSQIWQPLLAVDYQKEVLVGVLAEERPQISSSENWSMEIKYKLRKDAKFSNGKQVKYSDVLFSLKANISPLVNPFYSSYYEFIDSVSVDCADSSCFTIYSKDTYYLSEFSSGDYFIVSEDQFDPEHTLRSYSIAQLKNASENKSDTTLINYAEEIQAIDFRDSTPTIGSAPYAVDSWMAGEKMKLTKVLNWWGENHREANSYFKANAESFSFYFIEDATTAINALENGDFHLMRAIPPKQFRRLEKDERFSSQFDLKSVPRFAYQYLGFNLSKPLLSDIRVRKAIAYSVPTSEIIDNLYYGLASPCLSFQPQADESTANATAKYDLNQDSAKAYINAFRADHPNKELKLTYTYNAGNDKRKAIGLILKESLKDIGIELEIETYEWTVYLEKLRGGELDLFLNGAVNSAITPDLSNSFHSSAIQSGRNYFQYQDELSDQLLDSIHDCLDAEKRDRLFSKLEKRIFEQLPMLPLIQPMETIAFSKQLQNANAYRLRPNFWVAEISLE